ncbi:hypothetical protein PQ456_17915 [Paenibacillus kyungheensis]|uniref:DUF5666 domain-containing protein n=1 Tax=Paenibacillus kyungheensis TaxID=1452732 RepID=A0AAX3LZI6_9BACL|nr:hypothetical protein [Paenibacillus kyungheensis]WCT55042.1 hypothetical protein PQ456_17915 [Paenibacillus kyungheensis]
MKKWTLLLGTTMAIAMLSGCSTNSETALTAQTTTSTADASATDSTTQATATPSTGIEQATADLMGKIKSIDGNSITLYKSTIDPSQMGKDRDGGMSTPPEGQPGDGGASPADGGQVPPATPDGESAQVPANAGSQAPAASGTSDTTNNSATGSTPAEQGDRGGNNMFSEETMTITVSDNTVISAMTMENNEMTTTTKALSDLKADDVINVWLNTDDSSLGDQIQIVNGMGGGIRGGQMKDDTSSPTSSTTDNTTTAN